MATIRNHKKTTGNKTIPLNKYDNNSKIISFTILQFGEITHNHFKHYKLSNPESSKPSSPSSGLTVHYVYKIWFIDLILQQSYYTAAHIMEWLQMTLLSTAPLSICWIFLWVQTHPVTVILLPFTLTVLEYIHAHRKSSGRSRPYVCNTFH